MHWLLWSDFLCDHCKSWAIDEWCCVQTFFGELVEEHERERKRGRLYLSLPLLSLAFHALIINPFGLQK